MSRFELQSRFCIPGRAIDDGGVWLLCACHAVGEQSAGGEGEIIGAGARLGFACSRHILPTREFCGEFD